MKAPRLLFFACLLAIPAGQVFAQGANQIVKGRILDADSKKPLHGVRVVLDPETSAIVFLTDENGYFRFTDVPVGRHGLGISFTGYETRFIRGLHVVSGKQSVINVDMVEAIAPEVADRFKQKGISPEPVNNQTLVSGMSFSSLEVEDCPGSFNDISRTALSFPGVLTTNDGQNHLVIRGNSPKGLQWRMEGIELPNLNHFSEIGASGGGVNAVSNNILARSDFLTGAFGAEYGNALSGVFDLRLRSGNDEKHEQTVQIGLIGTEFMVEGPIDRDSKTTYIADYRYSSLKLIQKLGFKLAGVPDFQDLSFKISHPTEKHGLFTLFGIGGLSHEEGENGYLANSNMASLGISNSLSLGSKTYLHSVVALSGRQYNWENESNVGTPDHPINQTWKTDVSDYSVKGSFVLSRKLNASHRLKAGIIYEFAFNDSYLGWYSDTLHNWYVTYYHPGYHSVTYTRALADTRRSASTLQAFVNWNYRITDDLTLNTGMHFIQFYLNNNLSWEPRASLRWEVSPRQILSAGFGIYSRKESMTLYSGRLTLFDGDVIQPNLDLDLAKAQHYVLGYRFLLSGTMSILTEAYYQKLYDVPAYPFPPYYSSQNFDYGFEENVLTNYGAGYNRGVEVSLDKMFSKGYYFNLTGTLYESMYRTRTGEWLHSKYDGRYASNGLVGREFRIGRFKQHTLNFTGRFTLIGGMRYLPVDVEQSVSDRIQVDDLSNGYSEKAEDYFRMDLQVRFRRNAGKHTGEWSADLVNLTNRQNMQYEYWDNITNELKTKYQSPMLLLMSYRIQL